MAGTWSIKRRKQNPRPNGQSSQASVLASLGLGHHSSPHGGSKASYIHLTGTAPRTRFAAAQDWHAATGRALPPSMRARSPLREPEPTSLAARAGHYLPPGAVRDQPAGAILDDPGLTRAQRRRLLHKAGSHGERPAGFEPRAQRDEADRIAAARNARLIRRADHLARLTHQAAR